MYFKKKGFLGIYYVESCYASVFSVDSFLIDNFSNDIFPFLMRALNTTTPAAAPPITETRIIIGILSVSGSLGVLFLIIISSDAKFPKVLLA